MDGLLTLNKVMALLNVMSLEYRCAHWESVGPDSYARHLLFERLYEGVSEDIDDLAEKMLGIWGMSISGEMFRIHEIIPTMHAMVTHLPNNTANRYMMYLQRARIMENNILKYLKIAYDELEDSGEITLGLDDFIMSISSKHEHNLYLLQQGLKT